MENAPPQSHKPILADPVVLPVSSLRVVLSAVSLNSYKPVGPRNVENSHLSLLVKDGVLADRIGDATLNSADDSSLQHACGWRQAEVRIFQ